MEDRLAWLTAERRRLARELHDFPGQELTALRLLLHQLRHSTAPKSEGEYFNWLEEAESLARAALLSLNGITAGLRRQYGGEVNAALELVIRDVAQLCGRSPVWDGGLAETIGMDESKLRELALLVREALLNAMRHGGEACLRLQSAGPVLQIEIRGGSGPGVLAKIEMGGNGLKGMEERAVLIGAVLDFREEENGGLAVILNLEVPTKRKTKTGSE